MDCDKNKNVIYAIYCDAADEWYIGRTCNAYTRFKQHLKDKQSAVNNWVSKYGENHIFMMIIKGGLTLDEAICYEAKFIYENYFQLNLVNRSLPQSEHLLPFCKDIATTEYYMQLCKRIEEDIKRGSDKSKHLTTKINFKGKTRCYSIRPYRDFGRLIEN